jgi:hypothetical protein
MKAILAIIIFVTLLSALVSGAPIIPDKREAVASPLPAADL